VTAEQDFEASIRQDERAEADAEWRLRVREHLCLAALAALRCIPDGEIRNGCVVHDGAAVRERLRLGYLALTREPSERDSAASGTPGVTPPTPEPFSAPHGLTRDAGRMLLPESDVGSASEIPGVVVEARAKHIWNRNYYGSRTVPADITNWDRQKPEVRADRRQAVRRDVGPLWTMAYRAGYAEAVARLRDDERYRSWWSAAPERSFGTAYWAPDGRRHLADYLETVGPDGPDVTSVAREEG
jgi:hypothetical protein